MELIVVESNAELHFTIVKKIIFIINANDQISLFWRCFNNIIK